MKHTRTLFIACICLVLINACKKKTLPEPEDGNTPQFYFKGNVNGNDVNLEAGVNDYYMYSSYMQSSSSNVYSFGASIKPENCTNCFNSISIEVNDHKPSIYNGPSGADSAFQSTFYPFCAGTWAPVTYSLSFYPLFNNTPTSYLWDFGDGSTSNAVFPSHIFKHAGDYNISLTVVDNFSCTNTVSNVRTIGATDNLCRTSITVTSASTLNATYSHTTIGTPPYSFLWDLGDGNFSTSTTPTHSYTSQGRYPVSLRVIDAANDTAVANINYVTSASNMCTTNYVVYNDTALTNTNGASNIIIKWTDSNGLEYSSNSSLQPPTSYFKIISATEYHTNELGQTTKKLHVRFKCMVYNGTNSMLIDNAEAIVVVAYK